MLGDFVALTNDEILLKAYAAYNHQDSEALLALVSEHVNWPNGTARLRGKGALRSYWIHQWAEIRTHDKPVQITELAPNKSVVRIRQVVRALDGLPISKGWFEHTHQIEDGVIVRMDIQSVATATPACDSG